MIIVIGGPTGSGKSKLAMRVARNLKGAIVNGDAFQVYRDFNIGTAKPSLADRARVKHYLFDFVDPNKDYNVKLYQEDFRKVIAELQAQNIDIVVVGGTGLYQKAAFYDYKFIDETEEVDLSDLLNLNDDELHEFLKSVDPAEAFKIHKSNRKRVLRAIAIYRMHGKSKTEMNAEQEHKLVYDAKFVALNVDRGILMETLDKRVDAMIKLGLVEEVEHLREKYHKEAHAFQAIGYKEIVQYLEGKMPLKTAIYTIKKETRGYAKRQVTFYRNQLPVEWYDTPAEAYNEIIKCAKEERKKRKEALKEANKKTVKPKKPRAKKVKE